MMLKKCPLLIQSNTILSMTVQGESHTISYMSQCIGNECAAYVNGDCHRFGGVIDVCVRDKEADDLCK